jgi:hypothetical protein
MDLQHAAYEPALAAHIIKPRLRRLYEYWVERKGHRRFPARRDIDPIDFSYVLGSIMLLDALRDPLRFRVRLHGTELVKRDTHDLTGKFLENSEFHLLAVERCESLIATGNPALFHLDRVFDDRLRRYEALWLPLSGDGANVTMLVCALIYQDRRWSSSGDQRAKTSTIMARS